MWGTLFGRAPYCSSARERSLCLTPRRVLIRRLEEPTQLGAQLLVVVVAVYRGSVLSRGLHHLILLADDHQRAIRLARPAAAIGHHPGHKGSSFRSPMPILPRRRTGVKCVRPKTLAAASRAGRKPHSWSFARQAGAPLLPKQGR